jgi:hypothetical protein
MPMRHYFDRVPGWFSFGELYTRMVDLAPADRASHFVELGCWKGKSTAFLGVEIINSGKPIALTAVDHFIGTPGEEEHVNDPDIERLYDVFLDNMRPIISVMGDRFNVLKEATTTAAEAFADASVHFIMVDADHTAAGVAADIEAWWPKLCSGGVMAGDDWRWPEVRDGVRSALNPRIALQSASAIGVENTHAYPWWLVVKT